jgi:hypothetical protein
VLGALVDNDCHLHYGIEDAFCQSGNVAEFVELNQSQGFSGLETALFRLPVLPVAPCARHGMSCGLSAGTINTSGTPCQDFSRMGLRLGEHGPRAWVFMLWSRLMNQLAPPVIVHENVPEFPIWWIVRYFAHAYSIYSLVSSSSHVGFNLIRRVRRYTIMFHKEKTRVVRDPFAVYANLCRELGQVHTTVRDCILATVADIKHEIEDVCRQRGFLVDRFVDVPHNTYKDIHLLLSDAEAARLGRYTCLWFEQYGEDPSINPDALFHLGDNPDQRCNWSGEHASIPGVRTTSSKYWYPFGRRWLLTKEILAAFGMPVFPILAHSSGMPLVFVQPGRDARFMAGNMMHLAQVGLVQLVALSCSEPR